MRARILDIDGCIAHDAWRIPQIDWSTDDLFKRYDAYHRLSPRDKAGNIDLFLLVEEPIVVLTSRPVHYRALTAVWLKRNGCRYAALIMRNNDDHRRSTDVKRDQVRALPEYGVTAVSCAYDDRPEILRMYRDEFGFATELRALHDSCAYLNPLNGVHTA